MNKSQKEFYRQFSQHGTGDAKVEISASEVTLLLFIAYHDIHGTYPSQEFPTISELAKKGFYKISFTEINKLPEMTTDESFELLERAGATNISDTIYLYLKNLCDLYRRRYKYDKILQNQPFPNADQVAPRSLLEYGKCDDSLLAIWLEWRKWFFDIDNRSGQETGYVFEPILASCLGGVSVSHTNSPVKRINDSGHRTSEGRQVDCYIEEVKEVYELKMRVTIAASGQGRFNEEMSFPHEAEASGLTPILVVFDETGSVLLSKLKRQFEQHGGKCFVGKDAWEMLYKKAGKEMSLFIKKYIHPPVQAMGRFIDSNPQSIQIENQGNEIVISNNQNEYRIIRKK
ncbi:MAG: hypothetical protein K2M96_04245 [Prevotella sp.]|nr:hypothetical protein [Prevotella sp.]